MRLWQLDIKRNRPLSHSLKQAQSALAIGNASPYRGCLIEHLLSTYMAIPNPRARTNLELIQAS